MIVPAGARHNVRNTGDVPLRFYTLYRPPEHKDGVVQAWKKHQSKQSEPFSDLDDDVPF